MIWTVAKEESGMRLLDYLRLKIEGGISLKKLKEALASNFCSINGRPEKFGSKLVGWGDKISFNLEIPSNKRESVQLTSLILFEDADLLFIHKPAGVCSEPESIAHLIKRPIEEFALAHRLDKETSGVLLLTKSKRAAEAVYVLFKQRKVSKSYFALVEGVPSKKEGRIENYLGKISSYSGQSIWGAVAKEKGLLAITDWKLIQTNGTLSLIECRPKTGRTHQIRVHLAIIELPIIGDKQYGRHDSSFTSGRCMLHAAELAFLHPVTQEQLSVKATLPTEFLQRFL